MSWIKFLGSVKMNIKSQRQRVKNLIFIVGFRKQQQQQQMTPRNHFFFFLYLYVLKV